MKLIISEKQLQQLVKMHAKSQELSEEGEEGAPEAGTSSDGEKKTGMPHWESGINRGPANQIAVTRWKDIDGVTPARGKANTLWEQEKMQTLKKGTNLNLKNIQQQNSLLNSKTYGSLKFKGKSYKPYTPYVYKTDDGENMFVNFKKQEYSEALLDLREFMFSGWGLATQLFVGVVGAEVGAPIALETMDYMIVANDLFLYTEQGVKIQTPKNIKTVWEKFKWQLSNNPDFLRVMEDLLLLATFGVVKGASNVINYFSKVKKIGWFSSIIEWIANIIGKIGKLINYIPGKIGKWLSQKFSSISKLESHFKAFEESESKYIRATSKIPKALYLTAMTTLGFEIGPKTLNFVLNFMTRNGDVTKEEALATLTQEKDLNIKKEKIKTDQNELAKNLFKCIVLTEPQFKNIKWSEFKLTKQYINKEQAFLIKGVKYVLNNKTGQIEKA